MFALYAHPASQPSRAVLWLCALNSTPCQVYHDPTQQLDEVNPRLQIPVLVEDDFTLTEMPAILAYLVDKFGWQAWYPNDLRSRARIQQYLHAHHTLTRLATLRLMAPHVLVAFAEPPLNNTTSILNNMAIQTAMADGDKLTTGQQLMHEVLGVIERTYLSKSGAFIGGLDKPSIADLACYEEIAQLPWAGLMQIADYENTFAWLGRMAQLPCHEQIHRYNYKLGDIRTTPPTMDRFMVAIGSGLEALAELEFELDSE
jgi:glutathione S-transferase